MSCTDWFVLLHLPGKTFFSEEGGRPCRNGTRVGENLEKLLKMELRILWREKQDRGLLPCAQISHLTGLGEERL